MLEAAEISEASYSAYSVMGKNISQASVKITKQNHENDKRQPNNLLKVLRPKVYITDSSNFKRLVQELTGKDGSSTVQFPPPQTRSDAETQLGENSNVRAVNYVIEDDGDCRQSNTDAYSSFVASIDSFEFCNNVSSPFTEGFRDADNQMYMNDATFDMLLTNHAGADWLGFQDLESWLLDIDHQPCPSFNGFVQNQEVSIYDYELSGLI